MEKHIPENIRISVVISFYNEVNVIPELLKRLRNVFISLIKQSQIASYELIFINDESRSRFRGSDDSVLRRNGSVWGCCETQL